MSIPILTLTTDKNSTNVDADRITIRQNEAGLVIIANLIDADNNAYDLTNCQVAFGENKNGGKMVADGDVEIVDKVGGRIKYKLNTAVYQESGDAWFEITDNTDKLIDTTTNFHIEVVKQADLPVDNENYWSKAEAMLTHVEAFMQKVKNDVNASISDDNNKVTEFISKFQQTLDGYKNELTAYDDRYKKLDSDWETELANIKSESAAVNQQAITDFKAQREQLDTDFKAFENRLKDELAQQLTTINSQIKTLQDSTLPDLQKKADAVSVKLDELKVDFNKVDFKDFVTKVDWEKVTQQLQGMYTNAQIDEKVSKAGKVLSVNGNTPNANGDVSVPIPNITGLGKVQSVNELKPDPSGNVTIPIPDLNPIKQDLTTVKGQIAEVKQSAMKAWSGSLAQFQELSNIDPMTIYFILSDYEVTVK